MPRVSLLPDGQCRYGSNGEVHGPGPRRTEGGNPGESSSASPEGEEDRQEDPRNVKDRAYNRRMPGRGAEFS